MVETVVGTTVQHGASRQPQPSSELRLLLQLRVTPEGDGGATLLVRVLPGGDGGADVDAGSGPASSAAVSRAAPDPNLQAVVTAESSLRLNARGMPLGDWAPLTVATPGPGSTAAPPSSEALQIWASVRDVLAASFVPLPLEPVGHGARWRSLERSTEGGAPVLRELTHRLRLDDGDTAVFTSSLREVAVSGPAEDPALPREVAMRVLGGVGRGRRQLRRGPNDWLPLVAEGEVAADLGLELRVAGGAPSRTEVQLTQLWTVRPAGRTAADPAAR